MELHLKRLAGAGTLALMLTFGAGFAQAQYGPPPPPPGGGWDAPPPAMRDAQRQGFRDGIEGARKDAGNNRRPNVNNRDEYRHPNVPHQLRRDYRDGFRRGYNVAMSHILQGGGPRPY